MKAELQIVKTIPVLKRAILRQYFLKEISVVYTNSGANLGETVFTREHDNVNNFIIAECNDRATN